MKNATVPRVIDQSEAVQRLEEMARSLPPGTTKQRASRLLQRLSYRVDSPELRAALVELGALALVGGEHELRDA
jgi:hypothetical protein